MEPLPVTYMKILRRVTGYWGAHPLSQELAPGMVGRRVQGRFVKDATLSGKSTSGEALFDRAKGRIESSKLAMKLDGVLNIEVGNMATEIKLNQEQTSSTKTFDKLPPEAEAKK